MSKEREQRTAGSTGSSFSVRWLRRFLAALVLGFAGIAAALWIYAAWGYVGVVSGAREALALGTDDGVRQAVTLLETPHIFSGYEPFHGFGPAKTAEWSERASAVVGRGREYSEREEQLLTRGIAYYIPAFLEHKVAGTVPLVAGDRRLAEGLLERWDNALRNGMALALHLSLVALIMAGLLMAYRKLRLFERFEQTPPTGQ
jgi:hypothetical protein